jgi:hypothetical protein
MGRFTSLDARVERIEFGKTQKGNRFFKVIKLIRGRLQEYPFLLRDYKLARDQIVATLSVGEELTPESVWNLFGYTVETAGPKLSVPTRPGLHEDCFVLPNGRVLGLLPWRVFLPSVDGSRVGPFHDDGDAGEWEAIPELAHGNPLLTMAIAFAVTGPVAALLGVDAPRIQLIGSCRPVISAVEDVVAAMWRRSRVEDADYAQSWSEPLHVLHRIAAERTHTMMVIDDAAPTNADLRSDRQSSGAGHGTHLPNESDETAIGVARATPIFSVSTDIAAARARRRGAVRGGPQDRLIDVALDDGRSWLEYLHDYPNEKSFLSALNRLVRTHSGFMASFIIDVLCDVRGEDLVSTLRRHRNNYLRMARNCFTGEGDHVMRHEAFATIFAAGAGLLVDWENVPWELSDLAESLLVCEGAAIKTAKEGF